MPLMEVRSSRGPYTVEEHANFSAALDAALPPQGSVVIADERLTQGRFAGTLSDKAGPALLPVPANEHQKSLEMLPAIFTEVIERGFRRHQTLIGIGGGIIQDITCFIASVLFRGASWSYIPTTFLAQCDSCIGSKSSINIGKYKNQIGSFHQPSRVFLTWDVLETLSPDDIRSGMGEAIKLHLLDGIDSFNEIRGRIKVQPCGPGVLREITWSSLRIKKKYIEEDEFDQGIRNLLNYGHTFGHAYESASAYAIPHGIAICLGMLSATFTSEKLGLAPRGHTAELADLLAPWFHPYENAVRSLDVSRVLAAMRMDKKNTDARVTCILTRGPGRMEKHPLDAEREVEPLLREFQSFLK